MSNNVALQLEQVIAAPLRALVDAQKETAAATHDFLLQLTKIENGKRVLETLNFTFERMIHDQYSGDIKIVKQLLSIPLISMLPVPYINVDEAEINFNAKIIDIKKEETSATSSLRGVKLYATYASRNVSTIDFSSEINIKIKIKRSEIPEGLAKTLTILSDAIIKTEER